jgi:hypothetical protein
MGRGQWGRAFANSPFASVLFLLLATFAAANLAALLLGVSLRPGRLFRRSKGEWIAFGVVAVALLLANWGYRIAMGMD